LRLQVLGNWLKTWESVLGRKNEMLSRMVILDGRDKSELEKPGKRVGDQ